MAGDTESAFWRMEGQGNGGTWTDERENGHKKVEMMKAGEHYEEQEEGHEKRAQVESSGGHDE